MSDILVKEWAPGVWTHTRAKDNVWEGDGAKWDAHADAVRVSRDTGDRVLFERTRAEMDREKRLGIDTHVRRQPRENRGTWY